MPRPAERDRLQNPRVRRVGRTIGHLTNCGMHVLRDRRGQDRRQLGEGVGDIRIGLVPMPVHQANPHQQRHRLAQGELDGRHEVIRVDRDPAVVLVDRHVHRFERPNVAIGGARIHAGAARDLTGRQPVGIALEQGLDLEDPGPAIPLLERAHFVVQSRCCYRGTG